LEPLGALQHLLERFDNRGVIIGGIAASLLGQPRLTVDLDAVILLGINDLPKLIEVAASEGMTPGFQMQKLSLERTGYYC
jgi:hypothetical protein